MISSILSKNIGFNTQPHEGGCLVLEVQALVANDVSTHSRTKAAAATIVAMRAIDGVSTHSRTKAAADATLVANGQTWVSTHSRTKAAALDRPNL